jgi:broad specificity phosphatase PhoE
LIFRLEPVVFEIERQRNPVIVISHPAVLRCLQAYLAGTSITELPYLRFPSHSVIKFGPDLDRVTQIRYLINPETGAVSEENVSSRSIAFDYTMDINGDTNSD